MKANAQKTAQLGELIVAAFDWAARYGRNPEQVSRLATAAVMHMLRHARKAVSLRGRLRVVPSFAN